MEVWSGSGDVSVTSIGGTPLRFYRIPTGLPTVGAMDGSLLDYSRNLLKSAVKRASRASVLTKLGSVCTGKVAQPDQKPRAESGPEIYFQAVRF